MIPGGDLETYAACRDCDWEPDPDARRSIDSQAEQHTKTAGHVTTAGQRPAEKRETE